MSRRFGRNQRGAIVIVMLVLCGCAKRDSTDSESERSGMTPRTDNASGCQYLTFGSSITPRMEADGKTHMGCKGVQP